MLLLRLQKGRFGLLFSSSKSLSRLAYETSMPPNFAFKSYRVASETSCFRTKPADFAPAFDSCKIPMICSSVNRCLFIVRFHHLGRTPNILSNT